MKGHDTRTTDPGPRSIILTGFMGTGKTAVGRVLAERLGRPFVDMDAVLEQRLGMTIAEVFRTLGEPAFRAAEAELVAELAEQDGLVVATGGGALLPEANRRALATRAVVILLTCAPEELVRRLEGVDGRPLLAGEDRGATIARLLAERRAAYEAIPLHLETTNLQVAEAAERAQRLAAAAEAGPLHLLPLPASAGGYDVAVGEGLLPRSGAWWRSLQTGDAAVVVSEPRVRALHGPALQQALRQAGIAARWLEAPAGESAKTYEGLHALYDQLLQARTDRHTLLIALGGGALSDAAGFAAATWMRGLPWVTVPTTLLAQIDAGIGGKVAIDHPGGKNLIGAFHPPRGVLVDPALLRTLPAEELRAGLAEVVKHGVIAAPELFARLEAQGPEPLATTVLQAVRVKVDVVSQDPQERGHRAVLNLGHTVGHAIERLSGFALRHGEAVSIGMAVVTRLAVRLGVCDPALEPRLLGVLERLGLPVRPSEVEPEAVWQAMASDKKSRAGVVRFVLPVRLGQVTMQSDIPYDEFAAAWREVMDYA
ncbi:MAG: 3-dehydroquinate synthase [Tepidimonas sp.]|uniref:3-dehydroquinate synthase n=1 Tax=Tepidimonas sp. TaxID=2002775 RepID=UPI004054BDFF